MHDMITLYSATITTALTGAVGATYTPSFSENSPFGTQLNGAIVGWKFTYGSGGTSAKAWVQTSFDGITWYDIAATGDMAVTSVAKIAGVIAQTPITTAVVATDGTGTTIVSGVIGAMFRAKVTTTGTYATATTLVVYMYPY